MYGHTPLAKEFNGVQTPRTDALVVTVTVEKSTNQRVLVDKGSSIEVMFYSTYKHLGLTANQLCTATTLLISITGAFICPLGLITFPVRTGSRVMIVVTARSGQFFGPLQYPPRSSLVACMKAVAVRDFQVPTKPTYFHPSASRVPLPRAHRLPSDDCSRHARLSSTHEANVLKIGDKERKLGGCMLTGLPTPVAPGLEPPGSEANSPGSVAKLSGIPGLGIPRLGSQARWNPGLEIPRLDSQARWQPPRARMLFPKRSDVIFLTFLTFGGRRSFSSEVRPLPVCKYQVQWPPSSGSVGISPSLVATSPSSASTSLSSVKLGSHLPKLGGHLPKLGKHLPKPGEARWQPLQTRRRPSQAQWQPPRAR
ncbi:hypothetical protein RHMOL_Rhmol01G0193200 [Rhododendron molle]|uniref:Uncharacterized protein n=1 Tax=Rhododendron molle TaxID=49168 RepID=A0ACC0Q4M5_RHOML|nr:hypothetical protein RHMOL_Rhmol01G0193200 [Rhododendron molle]